MTEKTYQSDQTDQPLKVAFFDTKPYTQEAFEKANDGQLKLKFYQPRLSEDTASLADGYPVICAFVNDDLSADVIQRLADAGVGMIAMRCAGYNNVDLNACSDNDISVARVPAYSPHAVAEHALALMLTLNRKIHRAHFRVREGNFSLNGLVGFDMHGKTVGVVGTGKIGATLVGILLGLGCNVLGYDKFPDDELAKTEGFQYVEMDDLLGRSDIVSLHVPLMPETHHIIDADDLAQMKRGAMLINTSRGGLLDTQALIDALKTGQVGSAGLDVYEEESEYFFEDFSNEVITDDQLARLLAFNNVIVTSHQGFLTAEALHNIAQTTLNNISEWHSGKREEQLTNGVCPHCENA